MNAGIVGFGAYIPKYRISLEEIALNWNQDTNKIKRSLLIEEKSVPSIDQDSVTMAVQATQNALLRANIEKNKIGAIYVGSESPPYAVKPSASIIGQALNIGNNYQAGDIEFACKAGTAAMQICNSLIKSREMEYAIAIGTDTAQAKPGDILEYSAGAASAAFILGNNTNEIIATIDKTLSFTSDTPDFWRRELEKFPQHAGRFTGEEAYFKHIINATEEILSQTNLKQTDFDYVIFHQPNGNFPIQVAKKLGFKNEQILPGLLVTKIGNSYSASSLLSLTAILDIAKENQKILLTSYGSGSGSDAFIFTVTKNIEKKQNLIPKTIDYINNKKYINYSVYKKYIENY
ncbi:MAG: hydroxymethylglutaryl-CoA synthase [Candidatus Babeliales bacterium]